MGRTRSYEESDKQNPPPWLNNTPDPTWLWYGKRLGGERKPVDNTDLGKNKKENDKDNKNSNNPWTYNNLSLFRYEFKTLFAITPESFCVTDAGSQTANVSFRIDLNSDRSGDDVALDYVLTGNNAEGTFDVYKEGLTAYDASDKVVVSGLDLNPVPENENEKKGTITVVKREVEYFVWKASFVKTDGELTGKETVSLTMQQGSGKDEDGVITIDAKETDRLDLNECPPAIDGLVENVEGVGVCLDDQTVKNAAFTFDVVLTESLNKDQTYYFQFDTANIDASEIDYTYTIGNSSTSQAFTASSGQFTIGTIENDEFPHNGEVTFLAKVESKEALKQTDSITLKLDTKQNFDVDTKFATANIDDFENCVIDGLMDWWMG